MREKIVNPARVCRWLCGVVAWAVPALASSQVIRLNQPFVFPQLPSQRDEQWVVLVDNCGEGRLREPVTLRQLPGNLWRMEGTLLAQEAFLCFAVPGGPGSAVHAVRVRPRELMTSEIGVDIDGPPSIAFEGTLPFHGMGTLIPPSVDGAWHDPDNPGQGLYLAQTRVPGQLNIVALWATYDDGKPIWLTGAGANNGGYTVTVPLYQTAAGTFPGLAPSRPRVDAWGVLELEYLGCHRMQVHWRANSPALPSGTRVFHQLTPDVTHECDIQAFARTVAHELFIYEPTVIRLP